MVAEPANPDGQPRIVIVGAGFGGLACAQALGGKPVRVTVIDRRNYHLFVPLLYQVATAALSPADISRPVRRILNRYSNIDVVMEEVVDVDVARRLVRLGRGEAVPYDRLVVATGSEYSYFGHDEWAEAAPGLKTIDDARRTRAHILRAFEEAEITPDPKRQRALTTIVIVGGGPTGVEMAGAVAELVRDTLAVDFRRIDPRLATIYLVEAAPRLLLAFPEPLARYAQKALVRLGVTVLTDTPVRAVRDGGVEMGDRFVDAATIIWGAGVRATPIGRWLGAALDGAGRIRVRPDLSVPGCDGIYALGDVAATPSEEGAPLPALAQVAKQQGQYLGRALAASLLAGTAAPPFRFRNRGNTAVIGRHAAIFDFGALRLKGWVAWMLWAIVHVYLLVGFQNRLMVSIQWLLRYITRQRNARLID